MPGLNSRAVSGLPSTMPLSLLGKRPYPRTMSGIESGLKSAFPPSKVPRGTNVATGIPLINGAQPGSIGRGLTPSSIVNKIGTLQAQKAQWNPSKSSTMYNSITRSVESIANDSVRDLYLRNQLVFVDALSTRNPQRGRITTSSRVLTVGGHWRIQVPREVVSLLSLPMLNYILRFEDRILDRETEDENWWEPEDVLERFRFDGTVRNEINNPQKINTDVRHYAVTFDGLDYDVCNIWGVVETRQPLWLIVKRIPTAEAPKVYHTSPDSSARFAPENRVTEDDKVIEYHPQPIQVVPWADVTKSRPSPRDLEYYDGLSQSWRQGKAIYVGWARESSNAQGNRMLDRSWYNATSLSDLPKCPINVLGVRDDLF
jgi:hypothetical protein